MKYKVVLVDDEKPALDLLTAYAKKLNDLEVVGRFNNAIDAKRLLQQEAVDILFTDIQMDDFTGIDLVKTLKNQPATIFTTAYSEYALEGYQLDVIDYLVKPISFQRFCKAVDKAIELCHYNYSEKNQATQNQSLTQDFFFVKTNRKIVKVKYDELLFVQSYGEYVKLYTSDDVLLALQTTNFMEDLLPSDNFIRIHRSHIVNINHIEEIEGNLVKIDRHKIAISKRMRDKFMQRIKEKKVI